MKTIVPLTDFTVHDVEKYNAMTEMTTALPNLQQITLGYLCSHGYFYLHFGLGHKYVDGEKPVEYRAADTANWTTHEIDIISNFRK